MKTLEGVRPCSRCMDLPLQTAAITSTSTALHYPTLPGWLDHCVGPHNSQPRSFAGPRGPCLASLPSCSSVLVAGFGPSAVDEGKLAAHRSSHLQLLIRYRCQDERANSLLMSFRGEALLLWCPRVTNYLLTLTRRLHSSGRGRRSWQRSISLRLWRGP